MRALDPDTPVRSGRARDENRATRRGIAAREIEGEPLLLRLQLWPPSFLVSVR